MSLTTALPQPEASLRTRGPTVVNLLRRRATVLVVLHTVVELRETCAMYNTTKKLPDQHADRATLNPRASKRFVGRAAARVCHAGRSSGRRDRNRARRLEA